jgi:hypothetical protein
MKFLAFFALVALVSAAEKEKSPEPEKKDDDKPHGLVWPLPDPVSEGDLMLHGRISYDRVRDLHKQKLDNDEDKMILAHGRQFLRRVNEFFEKTGDFKIMPVLCKDLRQLNASRDRWEIDIPNPVPQPEPKESGKEPVQRDAPLPKEKNETAEIEPAHNATSDNETISSSTTTIQPSSSSEKTTEKPSDKDKTTEKPTDKPSSTTVRPAVEQPAELEKKDYEARRRDYYRQVGENFARLLMREYRKEQLIQEESDYIARWISDEAVHYGAVAIFCNEGENVKDIKKQLAVFLEEKN